MESDGLVGLVGWDWLLAEGHGEVVNVGFEVGVDGGLGEARAVRLGCLGWEFGWDGEGGVCGAVGEGGEVGEGGRAGFVADPGDSSGAEGQRW